MSIKNKIVDQVVVSVVFAVLGIALLAAFVLVAEPKFRKPKPEFDDHYDEAPFVAELIGAGLDAKYEAIGVATAGEGGRQISRMTGSPGNKNTGELVQKVFRDAGLEVTTQEFSVTVPHTLLCEIVDSSGAPLEGITLYPFTPAGLALTSLPDEGITAKLAVVDSFGLDSFDGFAPENSIAVTTLDASGSWASLQSIGVPAVIVFEDETAPLLRANPDARGAWDPLVAKEENPYPRFYAVGDMAPHHGKEVTIRCHMIFKKVTGENIIGVLVGSDSAKDALVLSAFYDSNSLVPELAPGAEEAVSLASLLQFVEAFAPYRGKMSRDVIFVATSGNGQGMAGAAQLMQAIGFSYDQVPRRERVLNKLREHERHLQWAEQVLAKTADDSAWEVKAFNTWWSAENSRFQKWVNHHLSIISGELTLRRTDLLLDARLAYLRAGSPVYVEGFDSANATDAELKDDKFQHHLLKTMLACQVEADRAGNLVSVPLQQLVARREFAEWSFRDELASHMKAVADYHRQELKEAADCDTVRSIFEKYERTLTINLLLNSGGSRGETDMAMLVGIGGIGSRVDPIGTQLANAIQDRVPLDNNLPLWRLIYWGKADATANRAFPNNTMQGASTRESEFWTIFGRLSFSVENYRFVSLKIATPENTFDSITMDVAREQLAVFGPVLLSVAHGQFEFQECPVDRQGRISELNGYAFGSAGTGEMVPSHPMAANTFVRGVGSPWRAQTQLPSTKGIEFYPPQWVSPYGYYHRVYAVNFGGWDVARIDAARYDDKGRVKYFKDAGVASQGVFQTERVTGDLINATASQGGKLINVPLFRCTHVSFPDRSNPRTMRSFADVSYMASLGLDVPAKVRKNTIGAYLEPDFQFYVGLLDGAPDNPQVQTYRAFMLNAFTDDADKDKAESDIQGHGYLAADVPVLKYAQFDAAKSMLFTHDRRLKLQNAYKMSDERMLDFYDRGTNWLSQAEAERDAKLNLDSVLDAGRSLSYCINNHPVIRDRISQAVIGILWYLGLLVPFVFFFEKLVFGYTDIRKQLVAMGVVFLVVFWLLQMMHPAFKMVRSSLMILIGFVMFLLTMLVTLMVGGKFKQNIKDLRQKEGKVEGADVNRSGVIGTAFMLGLNNMRRRKVRTALTCITLILITFVMICFTSVSSDLVNVEHVTGRTNWNGLQIQKRGFLPITPFEVNNIKNLYGRHYPVTVHSWLTSVLNAARLQNAEIDIDREYEVGDHLVQKRAKVNASVQLDWSEPLFSGIDKLMTPNSKWFDRTPVSRAEKIKALEEGYKAEPAVILPDTVARALDIRDDDLAITNVVVQIRGTNYRVLGIIDSLALGEATAMDGKSFLPYDLNSVQALGSDPSGAAILPDDVERLSGNQVILVNQQPRIVGGFEIVNTLSCRVLFPREEYNMPHIDEILPAVDFSTQRKLVYDYLERVGEPAYYGVDGVSYYGSRVRAKTFEGVLQILIPIVIAALTVFSTMRGSVYERRGEIYVYNAVGIAPNHVFFMFMAEAAVYAVVGAMIGYLLSQGVGSALVALNWAQGMNMNYSSIETIYASLAIVGSVLLSTILPARSAARLAAPSEVRDWKMPEIVNDEVGFDLPFTFTPYDRVAVLSYMSRWIDAHGEGGSGQFYASPPEVVLRPDDTETCAVGAVPLVASTVWLKPYDLGVSQRLEILLPLDSETKEFIARVRLVRLSGTTASWERTLQPFMGVLRKQFLNWRAASVEERSEMYEDSKNMIKTARVEGEDVTNG